MDLKEYRIETNDDINLEASISTELIEEVMRRVPNGILISLYDPFDDNESVCTTLSIPQTLQFAQALLNLANQVLDGQK